jgi:hypothetical protein
MTQHEGELHVRTIQKAYLCWVESHPGLRAMGPVAFNTIRRACIRSTFEAFRLGVVGLGEARPSAAALWRHFFGWFDAPEFRALPPETQVEVQGRCFAAALSSFRIGARVQPGSEA